MQWDYSLTVEVEGSSVRDDGRGLKQKRLGAAGNSGRGSSVRDDGRGLKRLVLDTGQADNNGFVRQR